MLNNMRNFYLSCFEIANPIYTIIAGNDHFSIKKVSGHKTDIAFQRYNLVTEEEMLGMKWLESTKDEQRTIDTYMDTKAVS